MSLTGTRTRWNCITQVTEAWFIMRHTRACPACLPVRTSYLNRLPANEIFRTGICNGTGRFHIRRLFNNIRYEDAESYFFACLLGMSLVSCSHAQQQKTKEFRLPDVPVTLTAPEDRAAYLSLHYWDHFDFADTSLISRPEITEQAFVDFLGILPYTDRAQAAIDTLSAAPQPDRRCCITSSG